ncbi:MAG: Omp28-related outer membrane protein [Bacteroidia bacterium]|nr:Omp28-related outer membrane protein [Bacteroidia bacterium]
MKKLFKIGMAAVIGLTFVVSACKKETKVEDPAPASVDVPKQNKVLIMDITGTWCPPCGSYGIPGFNQAIRLLGAKVLPLSVHSGDVLSNTIGDAIKNYKNYTSGSVPRFCVSSTKIFDGAYPDSNVTANKVAGFVDTAYFKPVVANSSMTNFKIVDNMMTFDLNTKFFTDVTGELSVGVYIIEDHIISSQALATGGSKANQVHDHVLRGAATPTWGLPLNEGATMAKSGTVVTQKIEYPVLTGWVASNLHFGMIIWNKVGGTYYFVNAAEFKQP